MKVGSPFGGFPLGQGPLEQGFVAVSVLGKKQIYEKSSGILKGLSFPVFSYVY